MLIFQKILRTYQINDPFVSYLSVYNKEVIPSANVSNS